MRPPPPSPSLIDFSVRRPKPTLLDQEDDFGFPPPDKVLEPYRDNFSDDSDSGGEDVRSEGEKEVERLLEVAPVPRRHSKDQSKELAAQRRASDKQVKGRDKASEEGTISITLPDGSTIAFRPSTNPGTVSLAKPGIASGLQEALQLIQQLALGGTAVRSRLPPAPAVPSESKAKPVTAAKKRPVQAPNPPTARLSTAPWPILASVKKPSRLAPTARVFKPSLPVVPPSPSTSPSPPLSSSTLDGAFIPSSRTSSPDLGHPPSALFAASFASRASALHDPPIAISTPAEVAQLFKCDIKPVPYIECDFPYTQPHKKKRKGNASCGVSQPRFAAEPQKSPGTYERQLQDVLSKFGAASVPSKQPLSARLLNSSASAWKQSASLIPSSTTITNTLVDIDTETTSKSNGITVYTDLPLQETSLDSLAIHSLDSLGASSSDAMTGTPSYQWQRSVAQQGGRGDPYLAHRSLAPGAPHANRGKEQVSGPSTSPYDRLLSLPSARKTVPKHLRHSVDPLQASIIASWTVAEPSDDQKRYVRGLAEKLTQYILAEFGELDDHGGPRYVVDIFGSVSWGGETARGGDIDMVIRDAQYPQGYHPSLWLPEDEQLKPASVRYNPNNRQQIVRSDLPPIYDLKNMVTLLRRRGFSEVLGIYGASTPIAKFKDPRRPGMEADINVNDLGGWYNSRLILAYCEISPYVLRPLIHALKLWSKANYVNDPSGRTGTPTMSSYCLTLMAIGFLQHCQVLPNLQADVEVRIPDTPEVEGRDVIWAGWGKRSGTKINVGFAETAPPGWMPADITVSQAIRGFFAFFARHGTSQAFSYNTEVVSILNGGIINRSKTQGQETQEAQQRKLAGIAAPTKEEIQAKESRMGKGDSGVQPRNWGERRLVVQDPFIWQKNCTQSMNKAGLDRWLDAVDNSNELFEQYGEQCGLDVLLINCLPAPPSALLGSSGSTHSPSPSRGRGGFRGRGRGSPFGR